MYNYFTNNDFRNANPSCSINDMDENFLHRLDVARFHSGVPYIVNSAFRTVEHEKSKGRSGDSSHTKGVAVDLKATNARTKFKIITGLIKAGFTRIFVYDTFIHVDLDYDKDQEVLDNY